MKTLITIIILAIIACVLFSTNVASASEERARFMCSVGTGSCEGVVYEPIKHIELITEKPLQVDRAVDTATLTSEDERMEKLRELIKQLQILLDALRAQNALKV